MTERELLIDAKARLAAAQLSAALSLARLRVAALAQAQGIRLSPSRFAPRQQRRVGPGGMEYACL